MRQLAELAESDERILLMTGDLGFMAVEPFSERFPKRFFNVGVAEQNMVGLATGLAESGFIPFVYSIATFASLRPYEFIRNGPVLHGLPVRVVAIGGGFEYGHAGHTHHALEDLALMRVQPGLTVVAPADHRQAAAGLAATWDREGPVYYRLGKNDKLEVPGLNGAFELGRLQTVKAGDDMAIVTTGSVSVEAVAAAEELEAEGVSATVVVVSSFNPSPVDEMASLLSRFSLAMTVEAHYVNAGLGSFVSEVVAESGIDCRVVRCGVRRASDGVGGDEGFLLEQHGLSRGRLVRTALAELAIVGA